MKGFILESERLVLRRLSEIDVTNMYEYKSDPEVAKYQPWEHFTEADAHDFIEKYKNSTHENPGEWFALGIELKSEKKLIGDCALKLDEHEPRTGEIGITLNRKYQGKGFARESLTALLNFAFHKLGLHRVIGIMDVNNQSSYRLLESLGFRREGHFIKNIWFKGAWGDEFIYAILAEEWIKH